ncbi:hypothetical protein [Chamaesiphon sp. VAR_69_metabat_338]|uniref:hypothetical protein n=1 Tax=Chamaesiphon sp. VAR_69_metabat_338 TaxID=2964704 RepID=UPI00286E36E3|nr:hypothetical protein [Chamaesiphon sp. VAR_69_metabat_338]
MYQSSARKNFLDILSDPTAIAILASIALHAMIGSTFPFFTQPEKTGKKDAPTTVKVVELTPSEQQRIPQIRPTPKPVAPPVTQPIPTNRPAATAPRTPQFSASPQAIPFSPVRKPATTATPKPTTPKQQATPPVFDPNIFTEPKPQPSPTPKGTKPKPKPVAVKPAPTKPQSQPQKPKVDATPAPDVDQPMDWNGDGQEPAKPTTTPQATKPTQTPSPSTSSPSTTPPAATPAPSNSTGDGNGNGFYGQYAKAALAKELEYRTKYKDIVLYDKQIVGQPYPDGVPCPKVKQLPFIVLMVGFGKVPDNKNENDLVGETISPPLENDKGFIAGDPDLIAGRTRANKTLMDTATTKAYAEATTADRNRPVADRGKPVLYRYRVQFECKAQ